MICRKCGKDIEDMRFCPDCGEAAESVAQAENAQTKKKLNAKILAAGAVCAAAVVAVGAFFIVKANQPEDRVERTVNEVYELIQDDLLDPDSLLLREMYIQFFEEDEEICDANVSVTFTAGTKGGGVTEGEAIVQIRENGDNGITYAHSDSEIAAASDSESVTMNFTNYLVAEGKLNILQDPDMVELSRKEIEGYLD